MMMIMMARLVMLCCCMIMAAVPPSVAARAIFDQYLELPSAHALAQESVEESSESVGKWIEELPHANPKKTRLHFYVHDTVTGENPTAILIAYPNTTTPNPSARFGETYAMDDPVTVSPDPNSEVIGRAQGTFTFVGLTEPVLSMKFDAVFTGGEYNGSSISVLGNNPITHKYRELAVVGGTGAFRLATGIATVRTYSVDVARLNDILEYTLIIY